MLAVQPKPRNGPWKALLVAPDRDVAAGLTRLVSSELPGTMLVPLKSYPPRAVVSELAADPALRLCFLEVCSGPEAALEFLSEITKLAPELAVVAVLSRNDPDLILRCLRQGASEFLIQPFTTDQLEAAMEKLSRTHPAASPPAESLARVYCVMPGKGACGATTLACNLAFQFQRIQGGKILLADMDALTGTVAFLLKVKSNYSFLDALTRAASLDADLWRSLVTACQGVDVLLSPENPVDGITEACDPAPVLHFSRQSYDTVVLDSGGAFGDWNLAIAKLSEELLLVTTNELPSLHVTQRALAYLQQNGIDRSKIRLVVDRFQPDVGLGRQEVQAALHCQVSHLLPNDYESIQKALLDGKPVLPGSKYGKSVAALAEALAGQEPAKKRSSLFSGLLSAFRG